MIFLLYSFESHDNFNLAVESSLDALAATNTTNILLSPTHKMDFALCKCTHIMFVKLFHKYYPI